MDDALKKKLDKLDLNGLVEVGEYVNQRTDDLKTQAKTDLKAKMQQMAEDSGMTLEEILGIKRDSDEGKTKKRASPKPKYQHPESGETWSGRGRMPRWLSALADEKEVNLDDKDEKDIFLTPFLIEQPESEEE